LFTLWFTTFLSMNIVIPLEINRVKVKEIFLKTTKFWLWTELFWLAAMIPSEGAK
jgi:hypothetical protein